MQRTWSLSGPLDWMRYINKYVEVKAGTSEEREHCGWLLTVDPVSASLVLVNFGEVGRASVRVVMGHVVEKVEVLQEGDQEMVDRLQAILIQTQSSDLDPEQLQLRKDTVQLWLQKNLIPVEEEGAELKVAGVLTISAPYRPEDCRSCNQIILDRIQRLIRIKPEY
ncbi:gem-associated protein 6 [Sphaeramia orbicularis]|uniref:Gem-associated protein 6 n=1 Tax=Sphaeramia orbicularis TaxID=375764 RepID=A0A672Z8N9_9TELE|nr:gem-associated protein 6 [Sphaeramia orbicularis]